MELGDLTKLGNLGNLTRLGKLGDRDIHIKTTTALFALLILLFGTQAYSYTVNIQHTGLVELEDENLYINSGGELISGTLKYDEEIKFKDGNTLKLKRGTQVGFYTESERTRRYMSEQRISERGVANKRISERGVANKHISERGVVNKRISERTRRYVSEHVNKRTGKRVIEHVIERSTSRRRHVIEHPNKHTGGRESKSDTAPPLEIYSLIITKPLEQTKWKFSRNLSLTIDCGKLRGTGASFLFFSPEGHLDEGCALTKETLFSKGSNNLLLEAWSRFKINTQGKLTYGQKVKEGYIDLEGQRAELVPSHSIAFHGNGKPYFFYLQRGQSLNAQTEYGSMMKFGQSDNENSLFATVLHESGQIESGWYIGEEIPFSFEALGSINSYMIMTQSPVRLHEDGSIHQIALSHKLDIQPLVAASIKRQEIHYGLAQTLNLLPVDKFTLPQNAQLIFKDNKLVGFTHKERTGLAFIYSIAW